MSNFNNLHSVPRMRTISEAAAEIKALDSGTALTEWRIRELALSGVLPRIQAGKKLLINLDALFEYLENPQAERFQTKEPPTITHGIRRVQ